jgi:rubrerythrin
MSEEYHYSCDFCGKVFKSFLDGIRHHLKEHKELLSKKEIDYFNQTLTKKWTCKDCFRYGLIRIDPKIFLDSNEEHMVITEVFCPKNYFFNHPNPAEECPNFMPINAGFTWKRE